MKDPFDLAVNSDVNVECPNFIRDKNRNHLTQYSQKYPAGHFSL